MEFFTVFIAQKTYNSSLPSFWITKYLKVYSPGLPHPTYHLPLFKWCHSLYLPNYRPFAAPVHTLLFWWKSFATEWCLDHRNESCCFSFSHLPLPFPCSLKKITKWLGVQCLPTLCQLWAAHVTAIKVAEVWNLVSDISGQSWPMDSPDRSYWSHSSEKQVDC